MTIRFDADEDRTVDGPHDYDVAERGGDGWTQEEPKTIWYLTDGMSNGRWLYVDEPLGDGSIPVGIARAYEKHLSPSAARSFALAVLQAAEQGEAIRARRKAERDERELRRRACEMAGGHDWVEDPTVGGTGAATLVTSSDGTFASGVSVNVHEVCRRCGHDQWRTKSIEGLTWGD